jgi:CBS domain-containing protein
MKVQDVMTYDVQMCSPETNLSAAAMRMWRGDFGILPVVASGKVIGVITDRDICMAAATKHRDPAKIRVKEVISGHVYGCSPDTDMREALKIMRQKQVRRLPIMDALDGNLCGILSLNDIALKAQDARGAQPSAWDVANTLRAICTHRSAAGRFQSRPTQEPRESVREQQHVQPRHQRHSRPELAAVVDGTS